MKRKIFTNEEITELSSGLIDYFTSYIKYIFDCDDYDPVELYDDAEFRNQVRMIAEYLHDSVLMQVRKDANENTVNFFLRNVFTKHNKKTYHDYPDLIIKSEEYEKLKIHISKKHHVKYIDDENGNVKCWIYFNDNM
jgi:hypothetical protein